MHARAVIAVCNERVHAGQEVECSICLDVMPVAEAVTLFCEGAVSGMVLTLDTGSVPTLGSLWRLCVIRAWRLLRTPFVWNACSATSGTGVRHFPHPFRVLRADPDDRAPHTYFSNFTPPHAPSTLATRRTIHSCIILGCTPVREVGCRFPAPIAPRPPRG